MTAKADGSLCSSPGKPHELKNLRSLAWLRHHAKEIELAMGFQKHDLLFSPEQAVLTSPVIRLKFI